MADDTRDPLSRLSNADPAQGAPEPDIEAIRARALDQSAIVPLRKRRTGVVVGAVAASIAVLAGVGLAGAAVGRMTAPEADVVAAPVAEDELPVVGDASPPIPVVAGQPNPGGRGATAEAGAMAGSMSAADKAMAIYPGYGAAMIAGPDLTDEPGTAPGYRLDSAAVDGQALARQLATVFGISESPMKQEYGWTVGSVDGTGPSIWVGDDAMVSWSFSDPSQDPWSCGVTAEPAPADAPDGSSSTSSGADPGAPEACEPVVPPLSQRDALREARKILGALGVTEQAVDGVDVEWETGGDDYTTWVTAWQRVDGQRTQLSWSFTFAGEDVAWANGFAAGLQQVPSYPIVGARTAVNRSSDPQFSAFGPTPLDYGIVMPMAEPRADATVSSETAPTAAAGDPRRVQVWWDPMVAVSAERSLAQYWQPDGTLLILPAYRVTTADDRGTWAIIAVAETAVDFVAPTE
ncbi:MAG: hypothetical protein ACO3CU_05310 [Candidatus Nanopelagicales bacterium]